MKRVIVHSLAGATIPRRSLEIWLQAMLAACPVPRAHVSLALLRDGDMARLNAEALGLPGPTNILSFPEPADSTNASHPSRLGELYLSLDTLAREARLYGQTRETHAQHLLAHGLSHLLGYDHGEAMEKMEEILLNAAQQIHHLPVQEQP